MKTGRCLIVAFAVLLAFWAVAPSAAMADVDVGKCRVARVGIHWANGLMVELDDLATTGEKWTGVRRFYLSPDLGNQGYATALTALSMGRSVFVTIAGTSPPLAGSLVRNIYINQD